MATNLLSNAASWLTGSSSFSVTNELTSTALWAKLGVLSVEIPSDAGVSNRPLSNVEYKDNGTYLSLFDLDISQVKIIQPSRMRITGITDDLSTLESIIAAIANPELSLTIFTKGVIANHMAITDVSFEQTPERLSATKVDIELEQSIAPASASYNPAQAGDQSQYGFRVQTPLSATQTVSGLFAKVASKVTNVVEPIAGALLGSQGEAFTLDQSKV